MQCPDHLMTERMNRTEFNDTDEVKFIRSNTRGGRVVLTYKKFQYCIISPKWDFYWQCHFHTKLKCPGSLHLKEGKATKFQPHTHESSAGKMEISTMGTSDTTLRYSRTQRKRDICYIFVDMNISQNLKLLMVGPIGIAGNITKKSVKVLCTQEMETSEHSHLPINMQPAEKREDNKMLSQLFLLRLS